MSKTDHDAEIIDFDAFRPSKRRQLYRKRAEDREVDYVAAHPTAISTSDITNDPASIPVRAEQDAPIAQVVRQRIAQHRKRAGIEFTNNSTWRDSPERAVEEMLEEQSDEVQKSTIPDVNGRFAPQMGQTVSVDKHM